MAGFITPHAGVADVLSARQDMSETYSTGWDVNYATTVINRAAVLTKEVCRGHSTNYNQLCLLLRARILDMDDCPPQEVFFSS